MKLPNAFVVFALAATPSLLAQNLQNIDSIPYGPAPIALNGQDSGASWSDAWSSVDASHPVSIASYWGFENDVLDVGPFQSNGIANGVTYSSDVPAAIAAWSTSSLSFVSANLDYVDLDAHVSKYAGLNHGSIAVWVKTTAGSALTVLGASDSADGSSEIALSLSNGRPWYDVRGDLNSFSQVATATTINDGTWHHMCAVCEGNGVTTLYVDGLPVDTDHQGFFRYVFDLDKMSIGRNVDSGGPQWHFDGLMDDLTIWASPLSAAEVLQIAQGTLIPLGIVGTTVPVGPLVEAGSLANSGFLSNGLIPQGNKIASESSARAHRSFTDSWNLAQDQTYYLSCMLRREDNSAAIESAAIELTDSGATRGQFGWDASGNWVVGGGATTVGAEVMQPNTDYFCIMRIDASSAGQDVAFLKVYGPGSSVPIDDSGITTVGTGANQWTAESLPYPSGANLSSLWLTPTGTNRIEMDELRMGTTWESVVRLAYGTGCLGAQISATGRPTIGSSTTVQLSGAAANSLCGMVLGVSSTTSSVGPLPLDLSLVGGPAGCLLLNSNDFIAVALADAAGNASSPFALPANPTLVGVDFFAQWLSWDPVLTEALPFRMSDGLQILVEN